MTLSLSIYWTKCASRENTLNFVRTLVSCWRFPGPSLDHISLPLQAALARVIKSQSMSYLTLSNLGIILLSSIFLFPVRPTSTSFPVGFPLPVRTTNGVPAPAQLKAFCIQRSFSSVLPLLEAKYSNGSPVVDISDLSLFSLELGSDLEEYSVATFLEKLTNLHTLDMSSPGAGKLHL